MGRQGRSPKDLRDAGVLSREDARRYIPISDQNLSYESCQDMIQKMQRDWMAKALSHMEVQTLIELHTHSIVLLHMIHMMEVEDAKI